MGKIKILLIMVAMALSACCKNEEKKAPQFTNEYFYSEEGVVITEVANVHTGAGVRRSDPDMN
ncbi:MAG: hypothetical protein R3Y46_05070 [Opitutales bacterium]